MRYVPLGDTFYFKFTTRDFDTGAPQTLGGTPVISAYEDANATQITAGITLTPDYDSVTGLNHVAVVATAGNGYEAGKYYSFTITTGTVDGVSVVGESVHEIVIGPVTANLAAGAITDASLAGNMEIVFETDFATNYNTTRNAWATNYTDYIGTIPAAALGADCITAAKIADGAFVAANFAANSLDGKGDWNTTTPPTAAAVADAVWDEARSAHVAVGSFGESILDPGSGEAWFDGATDTVATVTSVTNGVTLANDAITAAKYDETTAFPIVSVDSGATQIARTGADADTLETLSDQIDTLPTISEILTTQMTEAYAADGAAPTIAQALFAIQQFLQEKAVSGTTLTVKQLDGSTTAMTFTLDSASAPTSVTRAT